MTNKIKALILTPCIIVFFAGFLFGINVLFTSSYGKMAWIVLVSCVTCFIVYSIIMTLLED